MPRASCHRIDRFNSTVASIPCILSLREGRQDKARRGTAKAIVDATLVVEGDGTL